MVVVFFSASNHVDSALLYCLIFARSQHSA